MPSCNNQSLARKRTTYRYGGHCENNLIAFTSRLYRKQIRLQIQDKPICSRCTIGFCKCLSLVTKGGAFFRPPASFYCKRIANSIFYLPDVFSVPRDNLFQNCLFCWKSILQLIAYNKEVCNCSDFDKTQKKEGILRLLIDSTHFVRNFYSSGRTFH